MADSIPEKTPGGPPDTGPATIDTMPTPASTYGQEGPPPPHTQYPPYSSSNEAVNMTFVKGADGILKAVQMVFSLVAFICASVPAIFYSYGGPWVQFVSMTSFLITSILYILHAFKIIPKFPSGIYFKFVEMCYYMFFTLCYFISGIVCSCFGYLDPSVGAAAFFCFSCMLLYGADIYFRYIAWRHSGEGPYFSGSMRSEDPGASSNAQNMQY